MWLWQHLLYKHSHSPRGPGQVGEIEIRMAGVSPCTKKTKTWSFRCFRNARLLGSPWSPCWSGALCMLLIVEEIERGTKSSLNPCCSSCMYNSLLLCVGLGMERSYSKLPFPEEPGSVLEATVRWLRRCHSLFPKAVTIYPKIKWSVALGQKWHSIFWVASICV